MRIVIDLQACQNGSRHRGIGRYALAMTKALVRLERGHRFQIVLSDAFPNTILDVRRQLEGLLPQEDILVFSLPSHTSSTDPANRWRTRAAEILRAQFISGLSPDLLFVPSLFEGYWDRTVVSIEPASYPVAVTLYDLIPLEYPYQHLPAESDRAGYFYKISNIRQADLLLAISDFVAEEATTRLGITPDRVVSTPLGVDAWFHIPEPGTIDRAGLLRRYGIDRPFVLNTSPLEFRKNIEGLIAGFASMNAAVRARHQLVIVGRMNADAHRYVAGVAAAEGLPDDAVVLAGFVPDDDLVALYNQSELFAFPSLSEGFGLPVLEAMACGAPVIGSSTTSIPEVIGREDLLFHPLDATAMGQAMERILTDPALQADLRAFGPRRAAEFNWHDAAATAMAAFERLHADRTSAPPAIVPGAPRTVARRPRLAFVTSTMASGHRLTDRNIAIATALAEHHDVLLVCPDGRTDDIWPRGVFEIQDFQWFRGHAASVDHILYSADPAVDDVFIRLMEEHHGCLLLQMPLGKPATPHPLDRTMPKTVQKALLLAEGYAGLIDALEGAIPPERVQAALEGRIRQAALATRAAAAGELPGDDVGPLPMPPLSRSIVAAAAFRAARSIPADAMLVAGFAADEVAAARLIRAFRSSRTAQDAKGHLILHVLNAAASGKAGSTRMFGNVHHLDTLDAEYRGVMSAAALSILTTRLPDTLVDTITKDAAGCGQAPIWSEAADGSTSIEMAIDTAMAIFPSQADDSVRLPAPLSVATIRRLEDMLHDRHPMRQRQALAKALPARVRDVAPSSNDLAALAIAVSRNEAHERSTALYCDTSAFASPGAIRRLDPLSRAFLLAFLKQAGPRVQPVYAMDGHFIVASHFVRNIIGLPPGPGFPDEQVDIRPGDVIIGFDVLAAFQQQAFAALRAAAERGAAIHYVAVRHLPHERSDLTAEIVDLALAWSRARPGSMDCHIMPPDAAATRASDAEGSAAATTVEGLLAAKIPVDILAVDRYPLRFAEGIVGGAQDMLRPTALPMTAEAAAGRLAAALGRSPGSRIRDAIDKPGYVITGHLLGSYSLAIINRNLARTLEEAYPGKVRFLPVETVPIDHTEGVPANEKAQMIALSARPKPSGDEIVISHHYPVLVPKGDYRLSLALFFWEESHVPAKTIRLLKNGFDAILSPTHTVTNALIDSGLGIPIATLAQPVDLTDYQALAGSRPTKAGTTTFLHVSSCFKRKGVDILLAAWARAFSVADNVELVIKTFPNPHNDIEDQVAALRKDHPTLAPIRIINRDAERDEMPGFYARADVMVLPSRGEGYNLPALEAMAAGIPLIVTGHGGHRDFCSPDEARLIAYRFAPTASHVGGSHSMWVEPDVDDLVRALREQVDPAQASAIEDRRQRAMAAAALESDRDIWLRREASVMTALLNGPAASAPRTAWVSTWDVQCGIAQYSGYLLDGMSAEARARTIVLCDERTPPKRHADIAYDPVWVAGMAPKADALADAVARHDVEALVIQHQDGLISWEQIGRIGAHDRLADTVKIALLHNVRNLRRVGGDELPMVLAGLARMERILVHNIGDVNFLLNLGLSRNVGLLPHGAAVPPTAPWPRPLDRDDSPLIGCHGFFFRHKGIDKLIRAAAILRQQWPGLRLRLVNARFPDGGHDGYITECEQLAADLGMADAIEWHFDFLPVERIKDLLAGCDLLVLPYGESDDSASGAVRVSLSSMVPFVATRVQIFAELGDAVAWADNNDPAILAATIAPLLESPDKRRAVQASMHAWLTEHDWDKIAGTLEGLIQGLVMQKRSGLD